MTMFPTRKLIFTAFAIILLSALAVNFLLNRKLNEAGKKLEDSRKQIEMAARQLENSEKKIDSMQIALMAFGNYLKDIQARVEIASLEKSLSDKKYSDKKDSISRRLKELYSRIPISGADLPAIPTEN